MGVTARPRPQLHFTPASGWINDPHGPVWADGRYHLFFQHNPAGTGWDPAIHWGHATSPDLLTWHEEPVALSPEPGELGCWSGAVVLGDRGEPTIFYTRVTERGQRIGEIVRATADPGLKEWTRDPGPVLPPPPPEVAEFRDPYVGRAADDWRMVVGAGLRGGSGAVLQYRSPDLRTWVYDGVAACFPDPAGAMWECPALFPLDGAWVLLVSVLRGGVPSGVHYAIGDYDGRRFAPRVWGQFAGDPVYATTAFTDRDGRRCAISWLREEGGNPWSGALSLPWVLRLDRDLLVADPHPSWADLPGDPGPHPEAVTSGVRTLIVDAGIVELTVAGRPGVVAHRGE